MVLISVLFTCAIFGCLNWIQEIQWTCNDATGIRPSREKTSDIIFPNLQHPRGRSSFINSTSPSLGKSCDCIFPDFKVFYVLSRKLSRYLSRHTFQNVFNNLCPFFHICKSLSDKLSYGLSSGAFDHVQAQEFLCKSLMKENVLKSKLYLTPSHHLHTRVV